MASETTIKAVSGNALIDLIDFSSKYKPFYISEAVW